MKFYAKDLPKDECKALRKIEKMLGKKPSFKSKSGTVVGLRIKGKKFTAPLDLSLLRKLRNLERLGIVNFFVNCSLTEEKLRNSNQHRKKARIIIQVLRWFLMVFIWF